MHPLGTTRRQVVQDVMVDHLIVFYVRPPPFRCHWNRTQLTALFSYSL